MNDANEGIGVKVEEGTDIDIKEEAIAELKFEEAIDLDVMLAIHVHSMHHAIHSCNSKSVTIALHEVRMKVYGVLFNGLFNGLFTLN